MNKENWLTRIRNGVITKGVVISGIVHKASPVMNGKVIRSGECPRCGNPNGVVFRSHMDGNIYILFCQKCGRYSWKVKDEKKSIPTGEGRCKAMTKRNNRCSNKATHKNGLCGIHESMRAEGGHVLSVNGNIVY
jgi:ribosomal protein S27AE